MSNVSMGPEVHTSHAADRRADGNETAISGQKKALELALHGASLAEILDVLVRTVEAQSTSDVIGSILLVSEDGKHLVHGAAPSLPDAYCRAIDGITIGQGIGSCGTAAFSAKTVVVSDIQTDPLWAAFKSLAGEHGLAACWSTPIFSSTNDVLGTFALYHRAIATPSKRDREIVELLGQSAAVVIERDSNARRREAAEAQLRAVHDQEIARLSAMFQHAPAGIAVLRGPTHVYEVSNPRYAELIGASREVVGKPIREALPELAGQGIFELLDGVYQTGTPFIGRALAVKLTRGESGARGELEEGFFDLVYQPIPGADGKTKNILVVAFEVTELVRAKLASEAAAQASEALTAATIEQSRETQQALLDLRAAKEAAEQRVRELEAANHVLRGITT